MSNPTARVSSGSVPYTDDGYYVPLKGGSFATKTYQNGEMIGRRSDGYCQSMDDSGTLIFEGIVAEHHVDVAAADADGAREVRVVRPRFIEMPLSSGTVSMASSLKGAPVYAADSGHVTLSTGGLGTANIVGYLHNVIGTGPKAISTTGSILFAPNSIDNAGGAGTVAGNATVTALASSGDVTITGADLVFSGTTGQNDIKVTDNLASALTISEATNAYLTIVTTNGAEKLTVGKLLKLSADFQDQFSAASADGAISQKSGIVYVTKAGVCAMTIADPTATTDDGKVLTIISTTANAHTLDNSAGSGFNAGGAGTDVGTFGGAKGDNIVLTAYQGKWYVRSKVNVTLA